MSEPREWGVGSGESEPQADRDTSTPYSPLPTPREPNWRLIYSAVIIELTILIVIFYAFTKAFA